MVKKCVYCNSEISQDAVVDICQGCMYQVWGPKMSSAILAGMEKEREKGNMELGKVSETHNTEAAVELSPEDPSLAIPKQDFSSF